MNYDEIESVDLYSSSYNKLLETGELDVYGNPIDWDTSDPGFSEQYIDKLEDEKNDESNN